METKEALEKNKPLIDLGQKVEAQAETKGGPEKKYKSPIVLKQKAEAQMETKEGLERKILNQSKTEG